jgi:hypothetical protein
MDIKVKISPLKKDEKTDKNWYDLEICTYKEKISGRFEHYEIRSLIQQLDNGIF